MMVALVLAFGLAVGGAGYAAGEDGVDAGSFIRDGAGSRAFGLGGAFVAIADDASTTVWNPAGLLQLEGANLSAMYTDKFGLGIDFQFVGATLTAEEFAFAVSVASSSISEIPFSGDEGDGFFSETQSVILGSVAYDLGNVLDLGLESEGSEMDMRLFVGANGKVYTHRLLEGRGQGMGLDLSVLSTFMFEWGDVSFGVTSRDVGGTRIEWTGTDHDPVNHVPWIQSVGLSTTLLDRALCVAVGADVALGRPQLNRLHVGAEYSPLKPLTARGGVVLSKDGLRVAWGASFRVGALLLDYAYVPHQLLGDSHVLSLSYGFPAWWDDDEEED